MYSNVHEFATDINLAKYPTKFIDICQTSVLNNEKLEIDFKLFVASFTSVEDPINDGVISRVFIALVSKLANTRINKFMKAKVERDLKFFGRAVNADEMLRPKLKSHFLDAEHK